MKSGRRRIYALAIADFVMFYAILVGTAWIYQQIRDLYPMQLYVRLWPFPLTLVACNAFIRLYHGNVFSPGVALSVVEELRRSFFSISLACLLLLSYLSVTRTVEHYSRMVIAVTYVLAVLLMPIGRWMIKSLMKRSAAFQIKVLIAGAGEGGRRVCKELQRDQQLGLLPVGFLDDNPKALGDHDSRLSVLGTVDEAVEVGKQEDVEYLVVSLPLNLVKKKMPEFTKYFKHVLVVPDNSVSYGGCIYPCDINGLAGIEIKNQLLLKAPRLLKTLLEVIMAVSAFLLLWPLFIVLAMLIKLTSRGSVLYRARRLGQGGKPIRILKFRTMYANADERLEHILAEDPAKKAEWELKHKLTDDPRVTPLGRILRKTSLDELPQFWNVLTGQLAVIGPRPIMEMERDHYGDDYELVSRAKPGITGLWQVSGRSSTTFETRIFLDRYYIMNWSPWLDYFIFLKTVKEVITCQGAL
jgi:Undecaprenyl-phosphate galactose phosphotransferase WbaP